MDDVDPDGEDLAVHGGADLGETLRLLSEAAQLPTRLLGGLLGAEEMRLLPLDCARGRQAGPD